MLTACCWYFWFEQVFIWFHCWELTAGSALAPVAGKQNVKCSWIWHSDFWGFFFTSLWVAEVLVRGVNVCAVSQASAHGSLQKHILWAMNLTAQGAQLPLNSICVPKTAQPLVPPHWLSPTGSKTLPKRGVPIPRAAVLTNELQHLTSSPAQMQIVLYGLQALGCRSSHMFFMSLQLEFF